MQKARYSIRGFSVVEALLAASVFALVVTAVTGAYLYGEESTMLAGNRARAMFLASEGLDAVTNIRDAGFTSLVDGTYGLATSSNQWILSGSSDSTGMFTRSVSISTVDANRKSVVSTVNWQQNPARTGSVVLTGRLSYWQKLGLGNWANTTQAASLDLSGNQNALKVAVSGNYAYLVRANTTNNFVVIDISNPSSPALAATLSVSGTPTNIYVSGNYAYVSGNDNAAELQIVNITTPTSPSLVGTYNATGNADANGVYVVGTTAYLVRVSSGDDEFVTINVSTPASPATLGSVDLGATGYEVVVSGNFAYVASGSNSQELQVVSIVTPAAPAIAGSYNASGNTDATTLALSSGVVYLGQGSNVSIVDVGNPLLPALLGTFASAGTVNDIALDLPGGLYLLLATQSSTSEFQSVNVSTPGAPVLASSVNVSGTNPLSGVAYDATLDRAFAVGQSDAEELVVVQPN